MRRAFLLALVVVSPLAYADDPHFELLVMGKSWHFGQSISAGWSGQNWNQTNPGLGIEYRWPNELFVGALSYYDSWRRPAYSVYGGYQATWHASTNWSLFAAARVGYMHGSGVNGIAALPSVGDHVSTPDARSLVRAEVRLSRPR